MIEYFVVLKRHSNSNKPDLTIFFDEDKDVALREMRAYYRKNGFTIVENGGRFTIADIVLIAKERIAGAPALCETSYRDLFDENDDRKEKTVRRAGTPADGKGKEVNDVC